MAISGQSPSTNALVENFNALDKRKKSKAPPKRRNNNPKQPVPEFREMLKCCKHFKSLNQSSIKPRLTAEEVTSSNASNVLHLERCAVLATG